MGGEAEPLTLCLVVLQNQSLVFNADGSLTSDGKKACELMKIKPEQLKAITEEDLIKQGVPDHIAKVRVEHLQEKRLHRLEMLENTIREGILYQLYNVLEAFNGKSTNRLLVSLTRI